MTNGTGGKIENWSKVERENYIDEIWDHDSLPIRVVAYSLMEKGIADPYRCEAEVYHHPQDDPFEGSVPKPEDRHRTEIRDGGKLSFSSMEKAKDACRKWMRNHPNGGTIESEARDIKVDIEEGAEIHHKDGAREEVTKIRDTGVITLKLKEDPENSDPVHSIGDTYDIEMDDIRGKEDIEILHPRT